MSLNINTQNRRLAQRGLHDATLEIACEQGHANMQHRSSSKPSFRRLTAFALNPERLDTMSLLRAVLGTTSSPRAPPSLRSRSTSRRSSSEKEGTKRLQNARVGRRGIATECHRFLSPPLPAPPPNQNLSARFRAQNHSKSLA